MKKKSNEIYTSIDESFLEQFSDMHRNFLESVYYSHYLSLCKHLERKPLKQQEFCTNMVHRRFRFYQLCCPYCGAIEIVVRDNRMEHSGNYNYCPYCGRGSVEEIVSKQLGRFTRISHISNAGIALYKKKPPERDIRFLAYDIYHMQLIELTSILEVILRDFFEALFNMSYLGIKNSYTDKIVRKFVGNDFMLIEKANKHYKKAFDIDIKSAIGQSFWDDLVDMTNMRNTMIHNNGMVDEKFRKSKTFNRVKKYVDGDLLILNQDTINYYYEIILKVSKIMSDLFRLNYQRLRNNVILLHYFSKPEIALPNQNKFIQDKKRAN